MPTKAKLKPRLAIGQPFVRAPEPVRLVGEQTGKQYARIGDNPNGPETLTVTPPSGRRVSLAKGGPVSMANGGMVSVASSPGGSASMLPYNDDEEAYRRLRQRQAMLAASQDVGDLSTVAQAQTMRNMDDQRYGALGVPQPTGINLPEGYSGNLPMTARANLRTKTDYLGDQFEAENIQAETAEVGRRRAYINQTAMSSGSSGGTSSSRRSSMAAPDGGQASPPAGNGMATGMYGSTQSLYGDSYQNYPLPSMADREQNITSRTISRGQTQRPSTTALQDYDDQQLDKADARLDKADARESKTAKRAGLVEYRDPYNPAQKEFLTPAEAAIRKVKDQKRYDAELKKQFPEEYADYAKASPDFLFKVLLTPEGKYGGYNQEEMEMARAALRAKGYSERLINDTVESEQIDAAVAAEKKEKAEGSVNLNLPQLRKTP